MTAPAARSTRVLVAEDDRVARDLLCEILRGEGYEVEAVDDGAGADRARPGRPLRPGRLRRAHGTLGRPRCAGARSPSKAPSTPVILITAFGDVTGAMEAIQRGAYDYVSKPFNVEELRLTVARALERKRLVAEQKAEPSREQDAPAGHRRQERGDARGLQAGRARRGHRRRRCWSRASPAPARSWWRARFTRIRRAPGAPFVPVNCTALTESLLESELFGHARGAFTGAVAAKRGLFETANGGTMFLDEIGDMGPKMQAQLLRTLQDGEVKPVGGSEPIRVDVRLVCATNKDLDDEVKTGRFREDLYFRINVVTVHLPAAARAARGRADPGGALPGQAGAARAARGGGAVARGAEAAQRLQLARQRARAGERDRARGGGRQGQRRDPVGPAARGRRRRGDGGGDRGRWRRPGATAAESSPTAPAWASWNAATSSWCCTESGGNKKKAAEKLGIDRRTLYRALEARRRRRRRRRRRVARRQAGPLSPTLSPLRGARGPDPSLASPRFAGEGAGSFSLSRLRVDCFPYGAAACRCDQALWRRRWPSTGST